jgi:hypothetical protein
MKHNYLPALLLVLGAGTVQPVAGQTSQAPLPLSRPQAEPAVTMNTVLEKTIFKVDVLKLDLWLGPETARRIAPLLPGLDREAALDSVALLATASRDAWAMLVFQRDVGLDRFLEGIEGNMRKARDAGLLAPAGYDKVAAGLPRSFAPLAERGIRKHDRLLYRVRGDTLRIVFQQDDGKLVVDETAVGPERRFSLLGSFFVRGSDLRGGLLASLPRPGNGRRGSRDPG